MTATAACSNADHPEETMTSLLTRLWRRPPRAEHLTFTVYTRAQCCCCHKALDVLKNAQERFGFAIEEVDVDSDPNLVAQFDTDVPVVALNGKVRFRGAVNPMLLDRLLLAEIAP
jgi:glutaredoxin